MARKKLRSKKECEMDVVDGQWGGKVAAETLEHWAMLMHKWAWQVTNDIRLKHPDLKNPDDPPEPPWDA